jgi:hypothetical protein
MRKLALFASLVLLVVAVAAPASATKPGTDPGLEDGHKIWICHTTRSLSNPYVKILIDIAAWDIADPDSDDHGPEHHAREKDGIEWADYALEEATDECVLDPPPPTEVACLDTGQLVNYVIEFDGTKLYPQSQTKLTASANIPEGTYDVILVSGDDPRGGILDQPNEQWLLRGTDETGNHSGYSAHLDDDGVAKSGVWNNAGTVTFDHDVTTVTVDHWWEAHQTDWNPNSVMPEAACLTISGGSG